MSRSADQALRGRDGDRPAWKQAPSPKTSGLYLTWGLCAAI